MDIPDNIKEIVDFLEKKSYHEIFSKENLSFGDELLQFKLKNIIIRLVRDRSIWSIEISSKFTNECDFYDFALIIPYLKNEDGNGIISIDKQIKYFINNFDKILSLFSKENVQKTMEGLKNTQIENMKRRFGIIREGNVYKHIKSTGKDKNPDKTAKDTENKK